LQGKIKGRRIIWISVFETLGYGIALMTIHLVWLLTKNKFFLGAIFTEKLWTQNYLIFLISCFSFICLGIFMSGLFDSKE
jgi:hypothetical protein